MGSHCDGRRRRRDRRRTGSTRTRTGGCSACRTRRSSARTASRATWWLLPRRPVLRRRGRARPARRCKLQAAFRFAAALFVGTLVLRRRARRRPPGHLRLARHVRRAPARRGQERVPAEPARVRLRHRASSSTASPSSCPRCRCTAPATRPGCWSSCTPSHIDTATPARGVLHRRRRVLRAAHLRARQAALRRAHGEDRRRPRRPLARDAPLRRHLRRRGLPHARPARRDRAAERDADPRRDRPRRRDAVRLVAARGRRPGRRSCILLRDGCRPALKLSDPHRRRVRSRFQGAARRSPPAGTRSARCRPPTRSTRSGSPRGARTTTGCSAPPPRSC